VARTGIRFHMRVSLAFDDACATAEAAVGDFYRMLEEAEQAGFMERQLIDISYGQATGRKAFTPLDGEEQPSDQTGGMVAWMQSLGLEADDLDELVHETVSQQASAINNGGLQAQIEFLVRAYGRERARSLIEDCQQDRGNTGVQRN
jgi:hypothetical protein